jgi:hypothetical protein
MDARKTAMLARHRHELEELDEQIPPPPAEKRCCRGLPRSGMLPHLPDRLLLHIFRMLSPANFVGSARDLLSLESVSFDISQAMRQNSHLALYPHSPTNTTSMDAREYFFYFKAMRAIREAQSSTSESCFAHLSEHQLQLWVVELLKQSSVDPVTAISIPTHSVHAMLVALGPQAVVWLKGALRISSSAVQRFQPESLTMSQSCFADRLIVVEQQDVDLACGSMTAHKTGGFEVHAKLDISRALPFDYDKSIRKLGFLAGIPRMSPAAVKAVFAIMNYELRDIINHALIRTQHANEPYVPPDADSHADCWTEAPYSSYPTSAFYTDQTTGQQLAILGTSVVMQACTAAGYHVYGYHNEKAQEQAGARISWNEEKLEKKNMQLKQKLGELQEKVVAVAAANATLLAECNGDDEDNDESDEDDDEDEDSDDDDGEDSDDDDGGGAEETLTQAGAVMFRRLMQAFPLRLW